jgi:hypothetical protein
MAGRSLNISLVATLTPLEKSLVAVGKMMTDFAQSIASTDAKLADSIRSSVDTMNTELAKVKQSFDNVGKNGDDAGKKAGGSLRQQLRQATIEAQKASEEFGRMSPQFIAAAQKAANLKDEMGDVGQAIDALNPDAKFKAVAGVVQGMIGGLMAVQGAMAAFGIESENAQKTMAKLQGLMALSEGINKLGGLADSMGAFKTQIRAAVMEMGAMKAAIAATGIGLLIVGVGLLAANWDSVVDSMSSAEYKTEKLADAQKKMNENFEKQVEEGQKKENDAFEKSIKFEKKLGDNKIKAADNALKMAQAQGKSENEILKLALEKNKAEQAAIKLIIDKAAQNNTQMALEFKLKEDLKQKQIEYDIIQADGATKIKALNDKASKDKKANTDKEAKADADALKAFEDNKEAGMQYLKQTLDTQKKLEDDAQKAYEENLEAGMQYQKQIIDQKLQSVKDNQKKELDLITKFGMDKQDVEEEFAKIRAENPLLNDAEIYDQMATKFENAAARMVNAGQLIQQAFANLATNGIELLATTIGELMAGGGSLESFFNSLVSMVADAAVQLGKQFVQMGISALIIQTQLFTNPVAAIAAGAALIAIGSAAKSSMANLGKEETTGFAAGGVVYGPTNALIGEYSGASNNPEVVAPLDKLQGILMRSMGGGGGGNVMVQGVISGNNIRISQTKNSRDYSRITGRETRF